VETALAVVAAAAAVITAAVLEVLAAVVVVALVFLLPLISLAQHSLQVIRQCWVQVVVH
jgi:hypothetical protein